MIPLFRQTIILLALTLATLASAANQPHAVSSIAEFRAIPRDSVLASSTPIPVKLRATVTYVDPEWNILFVIDQGEPLFVALDASTLLDKVARGSDVLIEGHAIPGHLGTALHCNRLTAIGTRSEINHDDLDSIPDDLAPLDSRYVRLQATVASAVSHAGHTLIHAWAGSKHFRLVIPEVMTETDPAKLSGATIMASGIVGISNIDPTESPTFTLYSQSETDLEIISPPPPGTIPIALQSASEFLSNRPSSIEAGSVVFLTGTAVMVEDLTTLYIGDAKGTVLAKCSHGTYGAKNGDLVTLSGIYAPVAGEPAIRGVTLTSHGTAPQAAPELYSASDFVSSPPTAGALVSMNAEIQSIQPVKGGTSTRIHLTDGAAIAVAYIALPLSSMESLDLESATELSLTGLCRYPVDSDGLAAPFLLVTSPHDITVTNRHPVGFARSLVLLSLSALLALGLLAFTWVTSLRRQVAARTAELHQKTDRLARSEQNLAQTTARLRAVHDSVREAILITSADGRVLDANVHFTSFFAPAFSPYSLSPHELSAHLQSIAEEPESIREIWNTVAREPGTRRSFELTALHPSGEQIRLEAFTAPVYNTPDGSLTARVWIFRDVTEKHDLEKRLVHVQKMEAVSRLAAGIAHDFNNLLTGISGSISISRLDPKKPVSELDPHLRTAFSAAHRAKELVHRLLGFSRQSNLELAPSCANDSVLQVTSSLRNGLGDSITLKTELSSNLWTTRLDLTHFNEVIHNLCSNARDALPLGGTIHISTKNTRRSPSPGSPRIECVEITVTDDGVGIPQKQLQHIFEPFFSTKEQGKGTGLGLAMSFGVIEQHGGWMSCKSTVGKGTSVSIFVPRYAEAGKVPLKPLPLPPAAAPKTPKTTSRLSPGHVLIIDDEPVVRSVSEGIFRHHKFEVSTANNGREGLDWLAAHPGEAHIVVLDLTMPVLSGKETLRGIRALYPELPVVIASGYLIDLDAFAAEVGSYPDAFVQKPFDVTHILEVVRGVLSGEKPAQKSTTRNLAPS